MALDPRRAVPCPKDGCVMIVERGGCYSQNRSTWCDAWDSHVHTHCLGEFDLVGMETTRLRCTCHCHQPPRDGRPTDG